MDTDMLIEKFARMGVRARVSDGESIATRWRPSPAFRIDIGQDRKGEFFDLTLSANRLEGLQVTDLRPRDRHLLLQVDHRSSDEGRQKFLCGHDERHWFVAAVPEAARAADVKTAKEALKPEVVVASQARVGSKPVRVVGVRTVRSSVRANGSSSLVQMSTSTRYL